MGSSASKIFSEQFGNKELEKNFKHMKSLLDEIIVEILDAAVPSIKLVDFQLFKTFDSFPSYKHLVHVNELRSAELMNRDESFVVYISHAWSRLSDSSSNWEGYAQPDTVDNEKFRLCVIGIERACSAYAEGMKQCYIWLDYSCVSENSGFEYRRLDNLMEMSDCIFTPIFDSDIIYRYKNHKDTKPYKLIRNYFDEYPASNWNEGPNAYLNVGWCRLEMYCAATIPLPGRNDSDTQNSTKSRSGKEKTTRGPLRIDNFSGNFKIHVSNGRRPHILFGNYEELARQPPFILPSFHNKYNYYQTYFDRYVPCEGTVSSDAERAFMELWTAKVIPYIHSIETAATDALKDGYEGERNEAGEYEGEGSFRYLESGDIYEGQWKRGRKHGYGVYKSAADGVIYKGNWKADLRHGTGSIFYPDGDEFHGEFFKNLKSGTGEYKYANSDNLNANFSEENLHGSATFCLRSAGGVDFNGRWRNGQRSGESVFNMPAEDRYRLEWANDRPMWDTLVEIDEEEEKAKERERALAAEKELKKKKKKELKKMRRAAAD